MKELTIEKKYLIFSKDDFEESKKYLEEEAFFGDTLKGLEENIEQNNIEEFYSIKFSKSYGLQFHDSYDTGYDLIAVPKPEDPKAKK